MMSEGALLPCGSVHWEDTADMFPEEQQFIAERCRRIRVSAQSVLCICRGFVDMK